ncbi:hypothetical protein ACOME3_006075 [Neoechinorhynchus agilis]
MSIDIIKLMLDGLYGQHGKKAMTNAINAPDKWGWTPMHLAASRNDPGLLKLLISKGGQVNLKDGCGQTPLDWAKETRASAAVQTLKHRPDPNRHSKMEVKISPRGFWLSDLRDVSLESIETPELH